MKGLMFLKSNASKSIVVLVILAGMVALSACTFNGAATTTGTPGISIVSPSDGSSLATGDVTVTISVNNFSVVDKQGQTNVAGQGHIHYYLDVAAPTTPGKPAIPTSGTWVHVSALTYTFSNVTPGSHTIAVELVNNDHTPLVPSAVDTITINVMGVSAPAAAAPSISITSPANNANIEAGVIPVTVSVSNFNVVDKQGQTNAPGEGHVHFYLDVAAPTTPDQVAVPVGGTWAHVSGTSYTFKNVDPGTHTVSAQLVNNDHTPVIPLAVDTITVNVTSASSSDGSDGINFPGSIGY
jgi:hypothetical protein